jgi:bifunctional enzyme CysN/CysC
MPSSASEPRATCSPAATAVQAPLRVAVIGQVDHGKSTLVGRLLLDTGSLSPDRVEKVREISRRRGLELELAFVVDALRAERDQGITIDVSHSWLRTPARDYVLVDAPGHVEFLKNMVSGASGADAALLLVDAHEGVGDQSRRHALLLDLLGIEQVAVAVNKMDLVGWSEAAFRAIERDFGSVLAGMGLRPTFVPVSARAGANVSKAAAEMPWHKGATLLETLERFPSRPPATAGPLRFPLQDVYRQGDRRVLVGRIESGHVRVGDELVFSPWNKTGFVRTIERWGEPPLAEATAGMSIGITLEQPLFVERGQVASHLADAPAETDEIRARIFWFAPSPLAEGAELRLRLATQESPVTVTRIHKVVDVATLATQSGGPLPRNGIGEVSLRSKTPMALDEWRRVPVTGRFVLASGAAVSGAGVVLPGHEDLRPRLSGLKSTNVTRTGGQVSREERARRTGHRGRVIWLTGLPASGKSTISTALERRLFDQGYLVYRLDGDNLRHGLTADLGFSAADRSENVRRAGEVAKLLCDAGLIAIVALISPAAAERDKVRAALKEGDFVEVFADCPLSVCEQRDPKGLYKAARAGRIQGFTGIDAGYEPPRRPEVELRTAELGVDQCVERILTYVREREAAEARSSEGRG